MSTSLCFKAVLSIAAAAWLTLAASQSMAQTRKLEDDATARALFEQALAEMDAKQYETACPKLKQASELVPEGIGGHDALAQCYEGLDKLASAWAEYNIVVSLSAKVGQADRAKEAIEKAAALKPRLATLTLQVPSEVRGIAGLTIKRDGTLLDPGQYDTPVPVDAGSHEIAITAPGRAPSSKRLDIPADGDKVVWEVNAPALLPVSSETSAPAPWQRYLGLSAMGVGAVGVGVGAVLGGLAIGKKNESLSQGHCDAQSLCDDIGFDLRTQARSLGTGSTVALVAGGVLLGGGLVLFFTAPTKAPAVAQLGLSPGGVVVRGAW